MGFNGFDEMSFYFDTWNRSRELRASYKWIQKVSQTEIEDKSARKNYYRGLLLNIVCWNPYTIPTVALSFADQLYEYLKLGLPEQKVRRYLGEYLRQCHCQVMGKAYAVDGNYKKNYSTDIGLVYTAAAIHPVYLKSYRLAIEPTMSSFGIQKLIICERYVATVENSVAHYLTQLTWQSKLNQLSNEDIMSVIQVQLKKEPGDDLISAIQSSLKSRVSIITGEGGTGKTVAIETICCLCQKQNLDYKVVAFTGKAVSNIKERVIRDGVDLNLDNFSTIHSLYGKYKKADSPIFREGKGLLIFEEASMISTSLVWQLFNLVVKAGDQCQVLFVGDENQLPPIGWGQLFDNLIKSGRFVSSRLIKNYRINSASGQILLRNASGFKQDAFENNFEFHPEFSPYLTDPNLSMLFELYRDSDNYGQVMCITPFNKRKDEINQFVQAKLRRTDAWVEFGMPTKRKWYVYDKVIITRNSNADQVYNGTEGMIVSVMGVVELKLDGKYNYVFLNEDGREQYTKYTTQQVNCRALTITLLKESNRIISIPLCFRFTHGDDDDDNELSKIDQLLTVSDLDLAYCITTHKSQGSEAQTIVFDCNVNYDPSRYIPGGRANLYTAITRAKERFFYNGPRTLLQGTLPKKYETHDRLCHLLKA